MMKILHKTVSGIRCMALMLAFMLIGSISGPMTASGAEQNYITVRGTVFSNDGEPLVGAAVYQEGHNKDGVLVDLDGNFSIRVPQGCILVFSYLGFEEKELPAKSKMDVVLRADRLLMDEAVVVGYSKQNMRAISASVARVDMDNLENNMQVSVASMLAGQAAGLSTVTRSGVPGASGTAIVIRGNNSLSSANDITGISNPLYIIDGIPMSLQDFAGYNVTDNDFLSTLNPQDIQSIDILKDAAATAIYGSRGANGVVIITTRKGTSGAPRVTARASYGVITKPSKLPVYIGNAEREKKLEYINNTIYHFYQSYDVPWIDKRPDRLFEVLGYALPTVLTDIYNPAFNNAYDYQDMFYQSGSTQNYDISLEGGSESNSYRMSVGHYREKGVLVGYGVNRTSINTSLLTDINKHFRNELVLRYSYLDRQGGLNDQMKAMPTAPTELPSSLFYRSDEELELMSGKLGSAYNLNTSHSVSVGETLRIKILKSLSLDTQLSAVMDFGKRDYFLPSTARDDGKSVAYASSSMTTTLNGNSVLNYTETFGKKKQHAVVGLLGVEFNSNILNSLRSEAEDGISDHLKVISGYKKEDITASSDIVRSNLFSVFAMASYGYAQNRYKVEAVIRRDASSRFGVNNKYATFPSIKAHWAFSEEPWMRATKSWMDFGKVRVSYGTSGEIYYDPLLQYNSLVALGSITGGLGWVSSNKMDVKTYGNTLALISDFNKIANNDLSWSRTKEINYGLDLEFFNHRLYLTADIYSRYMEDLVYTSELPAYVGYNSLSSNLVDMVAHGFELSLTGYLFPRKSKVQWDWTLNLGNNQTKIAKLGNGGRDYIKADEYYAFIEGAPAFQYYMYEYVKTLDYYNELPVDPYTGRAMYMTLADAGNILNQNDQGGRIFPGMPVFTDVNGDNIINGYENGDDKKVISGKTAEPKITGGLNTNFRWKNLSIRINSSFAFGHWIFNSTLQQQLSRFDSEAFYQYGLYKLDESKFWTSPNDDSVYPMLYVCYGDAGSSRIFRNSSMFLERGDYWSLDNVTISYDLPQKWMDKIKMRGINVYVSGQNLAMWKRSSVLDPRMVSRVGFYNGSGYPISKTIVFGVQLQF